MDTLSDLHKEILKKRFWEGKSLPEVAIELGYGKTHIYTLFSQIMRKFRHDFRHCGYDPINSGSSTQTTPPLTQFVKNAVDPKQQSRSGSDLIVHSQEESQRV